MLSIFDGLRLITPASVCVRMLFALLCGGVVGLERSYKNRPAGLRTHMLVSIAATIASMLGLYIYLNLHLPTDMSRIGAQVVTGLSFLGAGTIIVTKRNTIKGLTTAAGLWATGIIGLAIGAGFYEGAIIATLLILLAETWFAAIGQKITHVKKFRMEVKYENKEALDKVMRYCKDNGLSINNLQIVHNARSEGVYVALLDMSTYRSITVHKLLLNIQSMEGVRDAETLD